ncbi:hypothetical protein CVD28_03160 [Bacillus sp. M6-12]|uniref:hypothetical protein n=1 Tax=Bacillus sp. M6-12 TaxID=2054166 RepID=UPI000C77ED6E|nr:hypothetical protein [Bacillus sp. M6-12]PLS19429.1 hypothetical protein CVD28_03160 [Bacillus sp. M6-12]
MKKLEEMINRHGAIIDKIEKLEDEKHELDKKILEETKNLNKEELLKIYPQIKSSEVKYQLFLRIKNG